MKHAFLLVAAILWAAVLANAQSSALTGFIENHKQDKGVTYAFLSKDLFEVVSKSNVSDTDWKRLQNVVKNLGSLSILAADGITDGVALYQEARVLVPTDDFDELLTVRDGKENVRIWAKVEGATITDLILLLGSPEEFVLICFSGTIELNNLQELAGLFDAGSATQLARSTEAVAIDFQISPNPNNGEFTILYPGGQDTPVMMSILDQNGRQLSVQNLATAAHQQVTLRDLPNGNYWLQLKTKQGQVGVKQIQVVKGN